MNKITPATFRSAGSHSARESTQVELGTPITPGFEPGVQGLAGSRNLRTDLHPQGRQPLSAVCRSRRCATLRRYHRLPVDRTDNTARKQIEEEQKKLDQRLRDQQFYTRSLIESNIDAS